MATPAAPTNPNVASTGAAANPMQPTARSALVDIVKKHLNGVVRDALNVQRHAKRARLHEAPAGSGVEGIIMNGTATTSASGAAHCSNMVVRRRLHAADINMALQLQGSEKLYATAVVIPNSITAGIVTSKSSSVTATADKQKIQLQEFLQQTDLPAPPSEVACHVHWLTVDGNLVGSSSSTSPAVAANRATLNPSTQIAAAADDDGADGDAEDALHQANFNLRVNQLQEALLSEELKLYYGRATAALERGSATAATREQQDKILVSVARDPGLQELIPFFVQYVTKKLHHQLAAATTPATLVSAEQFCRVLVRFINSMLINPHVHVELHLHEILAVLTTCIVARKLLVLPTTTSPTANSGARITNPPGGPTAQQQQRRKAVQRQQANHWALRREAAVVLHTIFELIGKDYPNVQTRALKMLAEAVSPSTPDTQVSWSSRYGGIVALSLFGPRAIDAHLLPALWDTWQVPENDEASAGPPSTAEQARDNNDMDVDEIKDDRDGDEEEDKKDDKKQQQHKKENEEPDEYDEEGILMCQLASLDALSIYLRNDTHGEKYDRLDRQELEELLGDRLIPVEGEADEYATCFV